MKHEILIYNKSKKKTPKKFVEHITFKPLAFFKLKQPVALAVLIVSPSEIKRLNKIWRHKNDTPDELSFGLNSHKKEKFAQGGFDVVNLGEIVVNIDKISDKNYLSRMLIHSLLHLTGRHHETSELEARKMESLEKKILTYLNS